MEFELLVKYFRGSSPLNYVEELRRLVGSRPLILVGAEALIFDSEERLLLLRRSDNGLWALPGGMAEPGETLEETAQREVFEETGLQVENLEFFKLYSGPEFYFRYPHGDEVYNVSAAFLCRTYSGALTLDSEGDDIGFFPLQALPEPIIFLNQKVISDYLASLS